MRFILFSIPLLPALLAQDVPPPFENQAPEAVEVAEDMDPFDPHGNAPRVAHVQVEWIELPHETLTDLLLKQPLKTAAATELRMEIQKLVKGGTAKVLETQMIVARSGEKATVESISEYIYPTEYAQPELPQHVSGPDKAQAAKPSSITSPPVPTSFETRNLGTTLEIEPSVGDRNQIIDLRVAPDLVWQTGKTIWQERKDEKGNLIKIEMPEIYSLRLVTALTVRTGVHALAGILSPKDQNGRTDTTRKVMVFVKADSLVVP